jgi:putative DNA primase/helicase
VVVAWATTLEAGEGLKLALRFTGMNFKDLARRIEQIIGEAPREMPKPEITDAVKRASLDRLWNSGHRVRSGDPVDRWMHSRGVGMSIYPDCLRTATGARYSGPPVSFHPAMLAKDSDTAGNLVMIHRTYLTLDGAKAAVDKPRMFCQGTVPPGSAVRLAVPSGLLGVAEGIETAIAAMRLFGVPTWAALNEGLLQKFEPPTGIERLIIFGDNDISGIGQAAAYALAARLAERLQIEVRLPDDSGEDWNDVLIKRRAAA